MSLLHSFYCWGHVGVVLLSTLFFWFFGIANWKILALLWVIIPVCNGILFCKVPIAPLIEEGETGMSLWELCKNRIFWILMLMMMCAGASEQAVSQWASTFAEQGLGREQDDRRFGRSDVICHPDGKCQSILRQVW